MNKKKTRMPAMLGMERKQQRHPKDQRLMFKSAFWSLTSGAREGVPVQVCPRAEMDGFLHRNLDACASLT